jgi:hypothetical protein
MANKLFKRRASQSSQSSASSSQTNSSNASSLSTKAVHPSELSFGNTHTATPNSRILSPQFNSPTNGTGSNGGGANGGGASLRNVISSSSSKFNTIERRVGRDERPADSDDNESDRSELEDDEQEEEIAAADSYDEFDDEVSDSPSSKPQPMATAQHRKPASEDSEESDESIESSDESSEDEQPIRKSVRQSQSSTGRGASQSKDNGSYNITTDANGKKLSHHARLAATARATPAGPRKKLNKPLLSLTKEDVALSPEDIKGDISEVWKALHLFLDSQMFAGELNLSPFLTFDPATDLAFDKRSFPF